jgi:4-amino-4-deoxy-L-arabinose transferase-like glycosyltransferase
MLKIPSALELYDDSDAARSKAGTPSSGEMIRAAVGFLLAALVIRGATFGYPVLHIDEQFYLLVGDRMLHGALPFVDIWDRKPVGLFMIYAGIRLLGGLGVVQYQVVATLFAAATTLVIYRMARMVAPAWGAWWAGVAYLLCLSGYQCFGGQAPVFFNLPMALAALILCRMVAQGEQARLLRGGLGVMALVGVALQIKYTVLFEGIAFGLALMWLGHRQGWSHGRVLTASVAWIVMALTPTLLAFGYYVAIGHGAAFAYANFQSIFARSESMEGAFGRLAKEMGALAPVWLAIFLAPFMLAAPAHQNNRVLAFLRFWSVAAMLGFLVFGVWYDHYVAPMLVPLMATAAPALGRRWKDGLWYTVLLILVSAGAAIAITHYTMTHHGTREQIERMAQAIDRERQGACIYINEGDPILYQYTHACIVTPYIFPNHLNGMVDFNALGINGMDEVARIMNQHPRVVVMTREPSSEPPNWAVRSYIQTRLARDYVLADAMNVGWRRMLVYRLKETTKTR